MSKKDKKDKATKEKNGSWLSVDGKKEPKAKDFFELFMDVTIFYMSATCAALIIVAQMKAYQQGVNGPTIDTTIGLLALLLFNNITWNLLKKAGKNNSKNRGKKSNQDEK